MSNLAVDNNKMDKEKILQFLDEIKDKVKKEDIEAIRIHSSHSFGLRDVEFTFRINGTDEEYKRGYDEATRDIKNKVF